AHDHLEGARLGHLDLLDLEGVLRFAEALLANHPGGHRLGQLAGLGLYGGNLLEVDCHVLGTSSVGIREGVNATRAGLARLDRTGDAGWPGGQAWAVSAAWPRPRAGVCSGAGALAPMRPTSVHASSAPRRATAAQSLRPYW